MPRALFVLSAAKDITLNDATTHPTGFWAGEFATPYRLFADAGWDLAVATPGGATPTPDPVSLDEKTGEPDALDGLDDVLAHPLPLEQVDSADYDLVFYPGGHGPMEDLAVNEDSAALLTARLEADAPLALLCHAPAVVLATANGEGASPFQGRALTGFSNEEERAGGLADKLSWLVEDRLIELGVDYIKADEPFAPRVVADGSLYSGQNPASAGPLAQLILDDFNED
ncbi:type 1 glutamine amidotransferase domain-containing protein [Corynebacterium auris]|uniref:type 1 glutamine amidotransferase domain-containing protein n=1 Tax=Corynebacterium auris TaxID=44750 RepID=UPI0025B2F6D6|nr:type 1 glutamine amidotransferase domain-containing protein [Corynebacterium auris]WJY67921.1 Molecular chaperone Hsp31 and glyoxalase 3 [Corynebacterium auris]